MCDGRTRHFAMRIAQAIDSCCRFCANMLLELPDTHLCRCNGVVVEEQRGIGHGECLLGLMDAFRICNIATLNTAHCDNQHELEIPRHVRRNSTELTRTVCSSETESSASKMTLNQWHEVSNSSSSHLLTTNEAFWHLAILHPEIITPN
jgi:hypothetical protein